MATEDCVNGNMKDSNYSSPVPFIGLYIAAATWVCLSFMIFDIISAFGKRQRWIPCRLFSLNSVTLTILSIISKLQVDLTTPMPSLQDQLSKLTGSTLLCILLGFLSPSIGKGTTSESLTNLAALTILVITVMVNISIQISTGVIFLFVPEHIIIVCSMLIFLVLLWPNALSWSSIKKLLHDRNRKLITKESGSLLERLRLCHLYGFGSNSQLNLSWDVFNITLSGFCFMCLGILAQAIIRSLILREFKFCEGVSDYKWSMWIIVISQIITVFVGCCASSFRGVTLFKRVLVINPKPEQGEPVDLIRDNPMLSACFWDLSHIYSRRLLDYISLIPVALFYISISPLYVFPWFCFRTCGFTFFSFMILTDDKYFDKEAVQDYKHLIGEGAIELNEWTIWKAATDMNSWMEASIRKTPVHLSQLFSRTAPSPGLQTLDLKGLLYPNDQYGIELYPNDQHGIEVSPLSMALLVKLAAFSIPGDRTEALDHAFREVFEIVDFVYTRISNTTLENILKSELAKAVMLGNGFSVFHRTGRSLHRDEFRLEHALESVENLMNKMPDDFVLKKVRAITNFIYCQQYETIEHLRNYLEQIFVDMVHLFLVQFPNVVFKYVNESPAEKFEERVRFALKLIWKIESLEAQVQWSFPVGTNIWSLITPQASADQNSSAASTENSFNCSWRNDVIVSLE